jgi:hypothetical protein
MTERKTGTIIIIITTTTTTTTSFVGPWPLLQFHNPNTVGGGTR